MSETTDSTSQSDSTKQTGSTTGQADSTGSTGQRKVIIIGGGPAGLTAAIYCARAGLNPLVAAGGVDGQCVPGGQLMTTTEVENYPGFPDGISGPELMARFKAQAERFGAEVVNEWASNCDFDSDIKSVFIGSTQYFAQTVIIATGAMASWLGLPGEEDFKNNGISACATCDGALPCFRDQHLHVIGGGDTAMEEALFLTRFASRVTVIHRRSELRASKVMQARALAHPKIDFLFDTVVTGYIGNPMEEGLTALEIEHTISKEKGVIPTGGVFMAIGHVPMTKFLTVTRSAHTTSVSLNKDGYIDSSANVFTNLKGVFTCGDVHDTHYRQAITAAGLGCMAAISCERYLESLGQ